jgi:class 3 adenylate cyclase
MLSKKDIPLKNELREVTILFADIRSFTAISESMQPEEVVAMLNEFFSAMVEVIFRHNGILDKFVGDQIMALFGVLSPSENAACDAVAAAVEMQTLLKGLMKQRQTAGKATFSMGIGINTGEVIVGNVGSDNHMDYTVIGDAVNVAAKLERVAQGGQIIIGERTYQHCNGEFDLHKREGIQVKNCKGPVALYEALIG